MHGTQGDLICCECSLLNIYPNVTIYALDTYGYRPSIMHIEKINDCLKRMYLINKYYPELNKLDDYKAQVLKQTTPIQELDNIKKSTINKKVIKVTKVVNSNKKQKEMVDDKVDFEEPVPEQESKPYSDYVSSSESEDEKPKKVVKKVTKHVKK